MTNRDFFLLPRTAESKSSGLTAIDLFCGAGGISLGLQSAGYEVLLASDFDKDCAATHETNFSSVPFFCGDVKDLTGNQVKKLTKLGKGDLDLLIGGPPCQGFSIIGARKASDPRNNLFREFMRIAEELKPKCLMIENVPGLATLEGGKILQAIATAYAEAGYSFRRGELLAAQYGVPQMRWRMFMIGWRNDLRVRSEGLPEPTHGTRSANDLLPNRSIPAEYLKGFLTTGDAIQDLPPVESGCEENQYTGKPKSIYQHAMRTGLKRELYNHYAPKLSDINLQRIAALKQGQDWRDLPRELLPGGMQRALRKDHTRRYRRMSWEGIPRSIITRFRDPKSGEYSHPEQVRTITIREAARIQSFPDWFRFLGPYTKLYDQVGNAVPPLLARAVANEIKAVLTGNREQVQLRPTLRRTIHSESQPSLFPDHA